MSYLVSNLTTGNSYTFKLIGVNFNGEGPASNAVTFKSCTAPSNIQPPSSTSTTKTTIDLAWSPPSDSGGCPITGYELYVDDGIGGSFTNTDSSSIANKPYLRSHQLNLPSAKTGKYFRIKIKAINEISNVESSLTSIKLADVPSKPAAAPVADLVYTNEDQIKVVYTEPADDGGTDIRSYELQMDDGKGGDF